MAIFTERWLALRCPCWPRLGERTRRGTLFWWERQAYGSLVMGLAVDGCGGAWIDVEMMRARC